jgi:glycosyltransferase involved in cell wall biosynthesis
MSEPVPRVSIVVPAYRSENTIERSLQRIDAQSWRDFEVIVVDSGPDEKTAAIVRRFPHVRFVRSETRLLPHAARNLGVSIARGALFVFTDPDVYADRDWLARLVAAHDAHGAVVVGAIDCYGSRLVDRAMHLCKFSKWLPYGERREVDMSPTANMLVRRDEFERAGGLPGEQFLGDVSLSRALQARGIPLMFEPSAVVQHHHEDTLLSFLRSRYTRGILYGRMRSEWLGSRLRVLLYLGVTLVPVRLARICALMASHAARGPWSRWILPFPLAVLGHIASLAGEAVAYTNSLQSGNGR